MARGGYQKPSNPAPVSGPGKYSRRTDGQVKVDLPDAQYGENAQYRQLQDAAPMAATPPTTASAVQPSPPTLIGFGEPTTMPDVPVTDGADYGPGATSSALGAVVPPDVEDSRYLAQRYLPVFVDLASNDDAPPGARRYARYVIAHAMQ